MEEAPASTIRAKEPASADSLRIAALVVFGVSAWGYEAALRLRGTPLTTRGPRCFHAFYVLFASSEPPFFLLLGVFCLLLLFAPAGRRLGGLSLSRVPVRRFVLAASLATLFVSRVGARLVLHDYALSMDEFVSRFQARIFAAGRMSAPIPDFWRLAARAATPVFVVFDEARNSWMGDVLPVYSGLRAVFLAAAVEKWLNPALAAGSVILIALLSRRLWPSKPSAAIAAVILLCLSSQFLLMSMTEYAYPAYLFAHLAWLNLYTRRTKRSWLLLPWVSVAALGLHNPVVHACFVAPFLISMLFSRDRKWLLYQVPVLGLGLAAWWSWLRILGSGGSPAANVEIFRFPDRSQLLLQSFDLSIVFSWQSPVLPVLFVLALLSWRRLEPFFRLVAASFLSTDLFYWLYPQNQQHGWGYRYTYAVLGNVVLLAVWAAVEFSRSAARARVAAFGALSVAASVLFQFPLRAVEAEKFVRPFARGAASLSARKESVVIVDPHTSWYAQDFVRNDPFLTNDPILLNRDFLTVKQEERLRLRLPGKLHLLDAAEIARAKGEPESANLQPCLFADPPISKYF